MRSSRCGDARPVRTVENSVRVASTDFCMRSPASTQQFVNQFAHVDTTVPTRSPHTIRSMLRSSSTLKT